MKKTTFYLLFILLSCAFTQASKAQGIPLPGRGITVTCESATSDVNLIPNFGNQSGPVHIFPRNPSTSYYFPPVPSPYTTFDIHATHTKFTWPFTVYNLDYWVILADVDAANGAEIYYYSVVGRLAIKRTGSGEYSFRIEVPTGI